MFTVTLDDAGLAYGDYPVFKHLSLILPSGQWTCLLGSSGVGKTSLLRFIAGLSANTLVHTTGTVRCSDGLPLQGRVVWMAQQDLLLPWCSVLANVTLGETLRSPFFFRSRKQRRLNAATQEKARALLAQVGLLNQCHALPQHLSGGQRQRVALARTLMEDRPLVLMDEPFSGLDTITRLQLQELAYTLLANKTVLLITHDPLEALRLGHRVYHLQGHPAKLTDPIVPPGQPLRSLADPCLMQYHGQLVGRLQSETPSLVNVSGE